MEKQNNNIYTYLLNISAQPHKPLSAPFPLKTDQKTAFSAKTDQFYRSTVDLPDQKTDFPTQKTDFPTRKTDFPTQKTNFPDQKTDFPTRKMDFPTQKTDFPI